MGPVVSIDIESYSEVDLPKVGLWVYASHPSTRIELASFAIDNQSVRTIDYTHPDSRIWNPYHTELLDLLGDPDVDYNAYNAQFERVMFELVWGVHTDLEQWHCTMVHAWSLGFSGGLADVGRQMGLDPDKEKVADGKKLVLKFCKPAPVTHKADRYDRNNSPQDWTRYVEYNRQDVVAEREVKRLLEPYPIAPAERQLYLLDQRINTRGLPIDLGLAHRAAKIDLEEKTRLRVQINHLTSLQNGSSPAQLLPWLKGHGMRMPNLQKKTVKEALALELPPRVRLALEIRQQISQTSTAKYAVVDRCTHQGRLCGVFQFAGAQRTQRWAGRMFQPHNLKQGFEDADEKAEILLLGDRKIVDVLYGPVMPFLANVMRAVVTAPQGSKLVVCDYAGIESRILGYMSGCTRINTLFAQGRDSYKDFATQVYRVAYEEVTAAMRKFCKPPVLGCGYQLGDKGLVTYADGMGILIQLVEATRLVGLWRELHPEVVAMWDWLIKAAKHVTYSGESISGYCVTIRRDTRFLFIDLPSGRSIAYYRPRVEPRTPPWGGPRIPTLTYMGRNTYTNQWERITTHGGKITENIDQAIARDILGSGLVQMERDELPIVGHVHDEVILEVEDAYADDALLAAGDIMSTSPPELPGLLLAAEGFITQRYKKP